MSIMFNGWRLRKIVLFKKDVVLANALEPRDFKFAYEFRKGLEN